jgi:hypothetical protein
MAGLALGSIIGGRAADCVRRPHNSDGTSHRST